VGTIFGEQSVGTIFGEQSTQNILDRKSVKLKVWKVVGDVNTIISQGTI
jgi:hypothetical protein